MSSKLFMAAVIMTIGALTAILMIYNVLMTGLNKYTPGSPKIEGNAALDSKARENADKLREKNALQKMKMQEQNELNKLKMQEEQANRLLDKYKRY